MYQHSNRSEAIREIQTYLFFLSDKRYDSINRIPIDGVFDQETEQAVIAFQKETSLDPTGIVDYETFSLLYEEYLSISPSPESGSNKRNSLGVGDSGSEVEYLNLLLYDLSEYYVDMPPPRRSRYFSEETLESVDYMRSTFMLAQGGNVDRKLIERLENELLSRRRISL